MKTKVAKGILCFTAIFIGLIAGVLSISASTYWIKLHNGFRPLQAYVDCYSQYADASKMAVSAACAEWNHAGAGN